MSDMVIVEKVMGVLLVSLMILMATCDKANAEWTKYDTAREVTWHALHVIDWGQTRDIAKSGGRYYEVNPILGKYPSVGEVDTYMIAGAVLHTAVSIALPQKYRPYWQYVTIGMSGACVINNASIGLRVNFD